jgi:peptide/nickel transport system ATP-binding protein
MVTHDIGVAAETADRIAVMYAGRFVEQGPVGQVLKSPQHPYTVGLLSSTVHSGLRGQRLETIPGGPPALTALPPGCAYAPRCPHVEPRCRQEAPPEIWLGDGRMVRCCRVESA